MATITETLSNRTNFVFVTMGHEHDSFQSALNKPTDSTFITDRQRKEKEMLTNSSFSMFVETSWVAVAIFVRSKPLQRLNVTIVRGTSSYGRT